MCLSPRQMALARQEYASCRIVCSAGSLLNYERRGWVCKLNHTVRSGCLLSLLRVDFTLARLDAADVRVGSRARIQYRKDPGSIDLAFGRCTGRLRLHTPCSTYIASELAKLGLPVHVRSLVLNYSSMSRGITDAVTNLYA